MNIKNKQLSWIVVAAVDEGGTQQPTGSNAAGGVGEGQQ